MKLSRQQRKLLEAASLLNNPVAFAQVILSQRIWSKQIEILESIAKHPRTAVKACHASGKTYIAALAVLWWIATHPNGIVVTTAPTWMQVEHLIWGEIHKLLRFSKIDFPRASATALYIDSKRYAIGLSTNDGDRFQGFHGDVLVVLDEATGVLPEIYEAIEGIRAGGKVHVLAIGNPLRASGPFYDAFTSGRESWNLITISAFDTPNLAGLTPETLLALPEEELDNNAWPYLTTRRWVKERLSEWGQGHQLWDSRVMGNFPHQSDDALFSLTWLEEARARQEGDGEVFAGVDVGGPGEDETGLCVRRGPKIVLLKAWTQDQPYGAVTAALMPFKKELKAINVDAVGIGVGMVNHLRNAGFKVNPVNVGNSARDKTKFFTLKAEIYWQMRERAQKGELAGLTDEKAIAQLISIRYFHTPKGLVMIESKKDAAKRGVKSRDRAEAIILAFADIKKAGSNLLGWMEMELEKQGMED